MDMEEDAGKSYSMEDFQFSPVKATPPKTYTRNSSIAPVEASSFYGPKRPSSAFATSATTVARSEATTPKPLHPIFIRGHKATPPSQGKKRKSSSSPTSVIAKKNRGRKLPLIESNKQYAIDAGQKDFDASTCQVCHMIYTKGEITDEKYHAEYHDLYTKGVKWTEWKNERQLTLFESVSPKGVKSILRVIAILPTDSKKWLAKVDSLFSIADRELGINTSVFNCMKSSSVYLIMVARDLKEGQRNEITPSKKSSGQEKVAGFLAAEAISAGCRLVSESPLCVSTDTEAASVGVTRIWIHHAFRRRGIGTKLLDTLRANFTTLTRSSDPRILKREEIAFSDPTSEGLPFAKKYTGQDKFLVFHYQL